MKDSVYRFKKTDLLVPGAALIMSAGIFFLLSAPFIKEDTGNNRVIVLTDGEVYGDYPLSEDLDIIIPGAMGLNNRLVIKNGEADILEAGCPDKICVHQKKIKHDGETIVCLPNRVVVEIKGTKGEEPDAVSR